MMFNSDLCWLAAAKQSFPDIMGRAFEVLTARETLVLRQRLQGCTLQVVATNCSVSREVIRQNQNKAIRKLRHSLSHAYYQMQLQK